MDCHTDGVKYLAVELDEIRKYTPIALRAFKYLVEQGCASWLEFVENPKKIRGNNIEENSIGTLAIGQFTSMNNYYLFIEQAQIQEQVKVQQNGIDQIDSLRDILDRYKDFCIRSNFEASYVQASRTIKDLAVSIQIGRATRDQYLRYFYFVNYMNNEIVNFPDENRLKREYKELGVAKAIMDTLTPQEAIAIVPYFVTNYHTIARKGYEETNIYMLKFSLLQMLGKMRDAKIQETDYTKILSNDTL